MTPERWVRVKEIVQEALERVPAARAAFVAEACRNDSDLRGEVESLLAAHERAGTSLYAPISPSVAAQIVSELERSAHKLQCGDRLGPYEVVEALGAGGMGEVYRARDTRLDRTVAIKVLSSDFATDPGMRQRFEREAQTISKLSHPHICPLFDVGERDGRSFLVMEYLEGESLADRLSQGPLPLDEALRYATQIAEALTEAHRHGIVHRDLKPANVMLTRSGAKLLDFGIAKLRPGAVFGEAPATAATAASLTGEGLIVGTPQYMAPEQLEGKPVDARTDVFAFGVVLYEMVTGRKAFEADSRAALIAAILTTDPRPLSSVAGPTLQTLEGLIRRCLAKHPEERLQSAQDLVAALDALSRASAPMSAAGVVTGPSAIGRRVRIAIAVSVAIVAIVVGYVWTLARRARAEVERTAAIAEVERLVDRGRFVDVWRAAQSALRRWPGDAQLEQLLGSTTMTVTIASDPPGADVAFKAYDDISGDWIALGTSPLNGVRAPLGMLRWRVTKSGFEPLEARLEVGTPAAAAGRPDVDAPPIRLRPTGSDAARMVFVPGGRHGSARLTDYWLDQTEVTNRDFKGFIDRGGYENPRYWTEFRGPDSVAARFRDRTGRPGPSTWELGTYPEGRDEYPVNGVSWFEAVAFCRAAGNSLPTLSHWRKAFGESFFLEVLTLGNFGGRGSAPVRQLKDVGPWGTYGMSGNVKEWIWNELEGRRYILGGAWNEPIYMATDDDARPPADRTETNGFRCAKESAPSDAAAYAIVERSAPRDYSKQKPVDAATFEIFRRFYSYDRTPLDARTEQTQEFGEWRRERVSFAAAYGGERVLAHLLIPKNAAPPYQAVIWFPGSYAMGLSRSDGDLPFSYYFDFLPRSGRALVYPVYKGTYERRVSSRPDALDQRTSLYRDLVVEWSKDLSRTIDYLESRSDFDTSKLAYYGFSMGAAMAIPAVALEPRLKTVLLLAGGLYRDLASPLRPT